MPRTLFDKVWDAHLVRPESADTPAILYVDLHLVHEVTSPQAFAMLRERGRTVRRPGLTVATMDHSTPTTPRGAGGRIPVTDREAAAQIDQLETNCREFGIRLHALGSERQGIVHVIGPELGLTQPGMTIVCGDSHTSTHGAFGALAVGIGTTEVEHVLATQTLIQRKAKNMRVTVDGKLPDGVTAKDIILSIIGEIGTAGGTGHVIEYAGEAIRALSMEGRMTVCMMSIEGAVPDPEKVTDEGKRESMKRALAYMGLAPGTRMTDIKLDRVFIGSCTNGRIEDLREVARVAQGKKVSANVYAMIVPGSGLVKEQAEAEGLDKILKEAGFDWREAGCSMCLGMNPDQLKPR